MTSLPSDHRVQAGPRPSVIVMHAHPDDEAIFTGATIRPLADRGARVVLVTATAGELGEILTPLDPGERVAHRRARELARAAELLGVSRVVALGQRDSGLAGWVDNDHPDALVNARVRSLARAVARLAADERVQALVHYDPQGIYEHPDHLAVHQIGRSAARLAGITAYEATIDADHLGGPGEIDGPAHLVQAASAANGASPRRDGSGIWARAVGSPTRRHGAVPSGLGPGGRAVSGGALALGGGGGIVPASGHGEADAALWIDATAAELGAKRAAMLAHASQIHPESLPNAGFRRAYAREWYLRVGRPSVLDTLVASVPSARDRGPAGPADAPADGPDRVLALA